MAASKTSYVALYGTVSQPSTTVGIYAQVPPNASAQWTIDTQSDSAQVTITSGSDTSICDVRASVRRCFGGGSDHPAAANESPLSPAFALRTLRRLGDEGGAGGPSVTQSQIAGLRATCYTQSDTDVCVTSKGGPGAIAGREIRGCAA